MKKSNPKFGIPGILNLYSWNFFKKSLTYPIGTTIPLWGLSLYFCSDFVTIIKSIVDLSITVVPTLIGFTLAGYALLIGFGNSEFITFISKNYNNGLTLYQKINVVFAFSLLFQLVFLIISSFVYFYIKLDFDSLPIFGDSLIYSTNAVVLLLLIFGFFYSLFAVKDMIANVFSFGQIHHYKVLKDNQKKEEADNNKGSI